MIFLRVIMFVELKDKECYMRLKYYASLQPNCISHNSTLIGLQNYTCVIMICVNCNVQLLVQDTMCLSVVCDVC